MTTLAIFDKNLRLRTDFDISEEKSLEEALDLNVYNLLEDGDIIGYDNTSYRVKKFPTGKCEISQEPRIPPW